VPGHEGFEVFAAMSIGELGQGGRKPGEGSALIQFTGLQAAGHDRPAFGPEIGAGIIVPGFRRSKQSFATLFILDVVRPCS
jgi:hypothetical protein